MIHGFGIKKDPSSAPGSTPLIFSPTVLYGNYKCTLPLKIEKHNKKVR
jgi:hypothetical protein